MTVSYATADVTATAPADYTSRTGTLTFNAGQTSKTISVPVVGDTLDEDDETFVVNLFAPTNATVADAQGVGTIVDNDATPSVGINNATVTEGDVGTVTATFTATLSAVSGRTVTVDYATADITATAPTDYAAASGTLTFPAGTTTRTIPIAVQGDLSDEADETYQVALSNPVNVTISTAIGTGTITDNDAPPSIAINDVSQTEGNAGTTNMNFDVSLSVPSGLTVTVNYATADSTAMQPSDYTTSSGTLTFTPGQGMKTISVPIVGDTTDEVDETFFVNLSGADERLDRRRPGRGNDRRRRSAAVAHDQRRLAHRGRRRDHRRDVHGLAHEPVGLPDLGRRGDRRSDRRGTRRLRRRLDHRVLRSRPGLHDRGRARPGRHHVRAGRNLRGRSLQPDGGGARGRPRRGDDRGRRRRAGPGCRRRDGHRRRRRRRHGVVSRDPDGSHAGARDGRRGDGRRHGDPTGRLRRGRDDLTHVRSGRDHEDRRRDRSTATPPSSRTRPSRCSSPTRSGPASQTASGTA